MFFFLHLVFLNMFIKCLGIDFLFSSKDMYFLSLNILIFHQFCEIVIHSICQYCPNYIFLLSSLNQIRKKWDISILSLSLSFCVFFWTFFFNFRDIFLLVSQFSPQFFFFFNSHSIYCFVSMIMFYLFIFLTPGTVLMSNLGLGRGCWDAEEAPISGDFSKKSSFPPCSFQGNTFVGEIPRRQCYDYQAPGIGGLLGHSWAPRTPGLRCPAPYTWLESKSCTCTQAYHRGPPGTSHSSRRRRCSLPETRWWTLGQSWARRSPSCGQARPPAGRPRGLRLRATHLTLRRPDAGLAPAAEWHVLERIQGLFTLGVFRAPELEAAEVWWGRKLSTTRPWGLRPCCRWFIWVSSRTVVPQSDTTFGRSSILSLKQPWLVGCLLRRARGEGRLGAQRAGAQPCKKSALCNFWF